MSPTPKEKSPRPPEGLSAEEMIREMYLRIVGDGSESRPGLEKRVDRIEQWVLAFKWFVVTTVGGVVLYVTNWVMAKFKGQQ